MKREIDTDELALVNGCLTNDGKSQKLLYEKYKNYMYSTCYRITGNFDDAQDALQEGFIQVFRNIKNYRKESALVSWIKTIIIRAALKQLKKLEEHVNIEDAENLVHTEIWESDVDGELLEKLIVGLPDKCRAVFLLIEVEGYSHKEVTELLNVTIGTSKSQLHYAKKILTQKLVAHGK